MRSSLDNKTVRPGSLNSYSFYYSRRTTPQAVRGGTVPASQGSARHVKRWAVLAVLLVVVLTGIGIRLHSSSNASSGIASNSTGTPSKATASLGGAASAAKKATTAPATNHCAGNTASQIIKVSISQRHLWACEAGKTAYDSAVITGMEQHASTLTPVGTYKIYAKKADVTLTGSDETGTWRDPVSYWMPFLDNQYGTYGFHDATWRQDSEFGKVDPNSDDASHGCVELPLGTSTWLYGWAPTGTTVSIES